MRMPLGPEKKGTGSKHHHQQSGEADEDVDGWGDERTRAGGGVNFSGRKNAARDGSEETKGVSAEGGEGSKRAVSFLTIVSRRFLAWARIIHPGSMFQRRPGERGSESRALTPAVEHSKLMDLDRGQIRPRSASVKRRCGSERIRRIQRGGRKA